MLEGHLTDLHFVFFFENLHFSIFFYFMEISDSVYYSLLALVVVPVYLFFNLWSWLGWELYKNN
ncbi:phosphatidylinositol N-acetylglucosaminyltransferase subunit Y-like [Tribolium castaneum]|uniref:phosphatidylinositol N-acetylglucosaminyltransferase subunit Y-like n=1 Tax=Tribolium castaneum TaxID=7070 RepID=UPI0030FED3E3